MRIRRFLVVAPLVAVALAAFAIVPSMAVADPGTKFQDERYEESISMSQRRSMFS